MSNVKAQSPNEIQSSKRKTVGFKSLAEGKEILAFGHLSFI